MAFPKYKKDPADVLDYLINWQAPPGPLLSEDETVSSSTWVVYDVGWETTTDLVIDSSSHTDTTATVWLSEGITGVTYYVTNHVITDQGREKDGTIQIICEEQ